MGERTNELHATQVASAVVQLDLTVRIAFRVYGDVAEGRKKVPGLRGHTGVQP